MRDLKDAIVTIDAMGTQKEIAWRIVGKGADYAFALKGDQTSLYTRTRNCSSVARPAQRPRPGRDRVEEGTCRVAQGIDPASRSKLLAAYDFVLAFQSRSIVLKKDID